MYLFDTPILNWFSRRHGGVAERIYVHPHQLLHASSVVILKTEFGLGASSRPGKHRVQLDWVLNNFRIADLDAQGAQVAGHLRHVREKADTPIGTYNLLIAGIALAQHFIVVTRNIRDV